MNRFDIQSADGTSLGVWEQGRGPAVVLVHGSIADHTTLTPFIDELAKDMTTYSMDRRGFGASGDAPGYAIERDFEDVAAVVNAVVARGFKSCAIRTTASGVIAPQRVADDTDLGRSYPR